MKVFVSASVALAALALSPVKAALPASVTALLDTTVDPCDDFYQYSCGNWLATTEIKSTDTSVDYSFGTVSERNEKVIQDIVGEDWPLVAEIWDSCMDTATLNKLGNKPLQKVFSKLSAISSKKDLLKLAGELSQVSTGLVTGMDVAADQRNAKENTLYVYEADLTLPELGYYLDEEAFKSIEPAYRQYISSIMTMSGYAESSANQGQQGPGKKDGKYFEDTVLAVEIQLATLVTKIGEQDGDNAYYLRTAINEAMAKYPLSIGAYFEGMGLLDKIKVSDDFKVVFGYYDYFEMAEELLASIDLDDLKTYVAFQLVNARSRYLDDKFYDAYFQFFSKVIYGQQEPSTRESICVYRVQQYFPDLIGKYYFMKMFSNELEDNAQLMTDLIEKAMSEHIQKLDWLDDATRAEAEDKLAKVANLIGQSKVKQNYPFFLERDTFFANVDAVLADSFAKKMSKIGQEVNRAEWDISPATVNAYYSPLENKMVFPAAILQAPFFNGTSHPAQNFGAIGAVIGHELTHGFDNSGRKYDGDGNERLWWTEDTLAEFNTRAQCMMDQYSTFQVLGEDGEPLAFVNGNTTIGENIADNGGFSLSWDAYHEYMASGQASNVGDVSEAEGEQLVFLSFAQTWCSKSRDGAMLQQLNTDPHSPGEWRANGVAMNNDNFAKVFQCDASAKMNPAKKCQLW